LGLSSVAAFHHRPAELQLRILVPHHREPLGGSEISEGSHCPLRFQCAGSKGSHCPLRFWSLPGKGSHEISQGSRCPLSPADKIWEGNDCPLSPADKIWEGSGCPVRFSSAKPEGGGGIGRRQARRAMGRRRKTLGTRGEPVDGARRWRIRSAGVPPSYSRQFSTSNPATRRNSLSLSVTRTSLWDRAWAAISMS